uniref:Uncharacterized protein n=1 Tax=Arundo donax TaxID=35708 RepID=A0A0A9G6D4_ARUDO
MLWSRCISYAFCDPVKGVQVCKYSSSNSPEDNCFWSSFLSSIIAVSVTSTVAISTISIAKIIGYWYCSFLPCLWRYKGCSLSVGTCDTITSRMVESTHTGTNQRRPP